MIAAAASSGLGFAQAADPFEDCEEKVAAQPNRYASTRCFYDIAARLGNWDEAAARLRRIPHDQPGLHWRTLALGLVEVGRQGPRATELLRTAAEGFHRDNNSKGEVIARTNLANRLVRTGPLDAAQAEADRATAVANASGDPELKMRAVLNQSQIISQAGRDLTEVYRVLEQTERIEKAPSALRRYVGHIIGIGGLHLVAGGKTRCENRRSGKDEASDHEAVRNCAT
ncbi:MAG: hypothetical protein AAF449_24055 [Myxococcota bacterium]